MTDDPAVEPAAVGTAWLLKLALNTKITAIGRDGSKLGTVDYLVVDLGTGQVVYAILSFGGFLGLGQKYHPVPFEFLHLSADRSGYVVDIERSLIDGSPSFRSDDAPLFDDQYGQRIKAYYAHLTPSP